METNNNEPLWTCRNLKDAIKTESRGLLGISLEDTCFTDQVVAGIEAA